MTVAKAINESIAYFKQRSVVGRLEKVGPKGYVHGWIKVGVDNDDAMRGVHGGKDVETPTHNADRAKGLADRFSPHQLHTFLTKGDKNGELKPQDKADVAAALATKLPDADSKKVAQWQKTPVAKLRSYLDKNISDQDRSDITVALGKKTKKSDPKDYGESVKDPDAWGAKHNEGWRDKLTPEEKQAARSYSGSSFSMRANKNLRSGRGLKDDDKVRAAALDSAIDKSTPLEKDTEVFRGLKALPEGWKVGSVITDPGFMSTSVSRSVAQGNFGSIILDLKAPKGAKAAFMSKTESPKFDNEKELLFPRGTKFRITHRSNYGENGVILHGEILE